MSEIAEFQSSRDEVLSRRMRSAKAAGQAPQWNLLDMDETPREELVPAEKLPGKEISSPDEVVATPLGEVSKWMLTIAMLSAVAAGIVVALMMAHKSKYEYSK